MEKADDSEEVGAENVHLMEQSRPSRATLDSDDRGPTSNALLMPPALVDV